MINHKLKINILFFVFFASISNSIWTQNDIDSTCIYTADKICLSKFKKGYIKNLPKEYRKISEENEFFGGEKFLYISNFNINELLGINQRYVYIPTGSILIFKFEHGLKNHKNYHDLVIQACKICGCGRFGPPDSALIAVSNNNIFYKKLAIIKNSETVQLDFDDYHIENIKYVKITGLSAVEHPYGFGLMNLYGFAKEPIRNSGQKNPADSINEKEVITLKNVLFEFNDSILRKSEINHLDSICYLLTKQDFKYLIVNGYTDFIGGEKHNYKLSLARANTIARYLYDHGIDEQKIIVIGNGEKDLLLPSKGDDPINRRVEIEIVRNED